MRPLVLISGLATGGAERVTASFLCWLARDGRNVPTCTVTDRHDGPLADELCGAGVRRHDLGARRLADARALGRLVRLLRRDGIDLVHAHGQDATILAAAARRLAGVRLVVTRHVLDEPRDDTRQRLRARAALAAIRHAHAAIAPSTAAAARLAELARIPERRIHVLPNGIDLDRYDRPELEAGRAATRGALGVGQGEPLVLMPAVLRAGKGHEVLLDAATALRARVPHARILLAGDGPLEGALRARAAPLGEAVVFLGRRDDVPALLAACDLVVLPSFTEALPTALLEAAAAGRPVVATRTGGTPEVVRDGVTGVLVPPDDPGMLADAMAALLTDPARSRAMGAVARRLARRLFGIDEQVRRTLALWEAVAGGGALCD